MYTIEIKGLAGKVRGVSGGVSVIIPNFETKIINGIPYSYDFSENFSDKLEHLKGIVDGKGMLFEFHDDEQALYVNMIYHSKELLSQQDLDLLIDHTQWQLSYGIGKSFEQTPCWEALGKEIRWGVYETISYYVSPWFQGQVLTATQK